MEKFFKVNLHEVINKMPDLAQQLSASDLIELNALLKQANFPELNASDISQDIYPKLYATLTINRISDSLATQYKSLVSPASILINSVVQKKYSKAEKDSIVKKLFELTLQDDWQVYNKNGLLILLECEHSEAEKIAKALNATSTLHAEVKLKTGTSPKVYVVKLDSINTEELLKVTVLKGLLNKPKLSRNRGQSLNQLS